jgi:hypothetical protein
VELGDWFSDGEGMRNVEEKEEEEEKKKHNKDEVYILFDTNSFFLKIRCNNEKYFCISAQSVENIRI